MIKTPIERLRDDLEVLKEEELLQNNLRDGCKKHSDDWIYHQKMFGVFYRARLRTEMALEKAELSAGIKIPFA